VWLINFIQIAEIPQKENYLLVINFSFNEKGNYRVLYDVFENKKIFKSEIIDFDSSINLKINLKYNENYKVSFLIKNTKTDAIINDTSFTLKPESNDYFIVGKPITNKNKYEENDSFLILKIPIYSKIDDTIDVEIKFESLKSKIKKNYKFYLRNGKNDLEIPIEIKNLKLDRYEGKLLLKYKKFKISKTFDFQKLGLFNLTSDELKNLIFALNYLYSGEFSKYLKKNNNDLKKAWESFWKDKDPTPNTNLNEEKELFLQRYHYVIKNYTKNNKINAMGLIYLRYGPPDYIEKSELNLYDRPYQIWYYESLNLRFIFIDKYGTGDYELAPSSWADYIR